MGLGSHKDGNLGRAGSSFQVLICRYSFLPTARLWQRLAQQGSNAISDHWTPVHLDFIVTDFDGLVARLCGIGASLDREVQIREYGRIANMGTHSGTASI